MAAHEVSRMPGLGMPTRFTESEPRLRGRELRVFCWETAGKPRLAGVLRRIFMFSGDNHHAGRSARHRSCEYGVRPRA